MKRKANPLIQAINRSIESSRNEGHALITRAKQLEEQRMMIRAKYQEGFKNLNEETATTLYVTTNGYKPTVHLTLRELEGFKDPQLLELLDYFMKYTDKIEEREWAQYLNKDYTIICDDVVISISAYVSDGSPTCRKVAVGTKMEEITTYKIVCD
jgi:hypothetical protein